MLGKLLKYDLKWIYKGVIIFYILSFLFSIIGRILSEIENSLVFNVLGQICTGTAVTMVINVLINNLIRVWARFHRNIYKDEAYLTHTLPVGKKHIYLAKVLSAIISLVTSVIVIVVCVAICYYSAENIEFIKNALEFVANSYNSSVISFLLVIVVVFFLEMMFALLSGVIGIIVGHKSNNYKMVKSVICGFIAYLIPQIVTLALMYIIGLFNQDIMNLFNTTQIVNVEIIKAIMYYAIAIYLVYIVIYYFIGKIQFEKGINVD